MEQYSIRKNGVWHSIGGENEDIFSLSGGENADELVCLIDTDGNLAFANDKYCRYFGKCPNEFVGHQFIPLICESDRRKSRLLISSLGRDNPVTTEKYRVLLPDGKVRWQKWTSRGVFDAEGKMVELLATGHELPRMGISEQISGNAADHYKALIYNMTYGFGLFSISRNQQGVPCNFSVLEINPALEDLLGVNAESLQGKALSSVLPELDQSWFEMCVRAAFTGKPIQIKRHFKSIDKKLQILTYCPREDQIAGIFGDITRQDNVEKQMRGSEKRFRAISEYANVGILVANGGGGFVYANRQAAAITGYSVSELLQISFEDLNHPSERGKSSDRLAKSINGKSIPGRYEMLFVKKDGSSLPVEISDSRMIWSDQPVLLMFFKDMSLQRLMEEEQGKAHLELEQRVKERTHELTDVANKLEQNQQELLRNKKELERANKELVQTNTALSVLARNIDRKRDEVEKKIAQSVRSHVLPLIRELSDDNISDSIRAKMEVLAVYLNGLTPGATKSTDVIAVLSTTELRVAMMIKNGFSSEDVARLLYISLHTVKTHRRNIRRKLGINNKSINLASYLKFKLG